MSKEGRRRAGRFLYGRPQVLALIAVAFGILLLIRVKDESPERYTVLDLAEHPPGTATPYVPKKSHFPPFYLVHTPDGAVYAIVRRDPHSNCHVLWNEDENHFEDPCEGNLYDWVGAPLSREGAGLARLHIERSEADRVLIDMGIIRPFDPS